MIAFIAGVLAHRRTVQALFAVLVVAMLPGVARLETDNSAEVFFLAGSSDLARYKAFVDRFGPDAGLRIVLSGERLFSAEGLAFLARLEEESARIDGVRSASGPVGHHRSRLPQFPPAEPAEFRLLLLGNALDRAAGFVTATGNEVSILLELAPSSGERKELLLADLERRIAAAPPGVAATMVGEAMFQRALNVSGREVERVYFPLLLGLAALLLAATFREAGAVALPLAFVATVEIVVLGAMGYAGVKVNLVVAILPPILFVIALASAVHLMLRCRDIEADPMSEGPEAAGALASAPRRATRAMRPLPSRALLQRAMRSPRRSPPIATRAGRSSGRRSRRSPASPRSPRRRWRRSAPSASGRGSASPSRGWPRSPCSRVSSPARWAGARAFPSAPSSCVCSISAGG